MISWVPVTLAAATAQTARFILQKHLKDTRLSTTGATFARFVFSAPAVVAMTLAYVYAGDQGVVLANTRFWLFALSGGVFQILATLSLIALFAERNFAVGLTLKNSEILIAALIGFVLFGDRVSAGALVAIVLGIAAVLLLNAGTLGNRGLFTARPFWNRAMVLGLAAGIMFAISGICYRGASLSLELENRLLSAGVTLAVVTTSQSVLMGGWMMRNEPGQIVAVFRAWRVSALVGLTSMIGSYCWFLAFTLQNVAYVKALGQAELLLGVVASLLVFHERIARQELAGMLLLAVSIVLLLFSA